jgi:hypothetical protein
MYARRRLKAARVTQRALSKAFVGARATGLAIDARRLICKALVTSYVALVAHGSIRHRGKRARLTNRAVDETAD